MEIGKIGVSNWFQEKVIDPLLQILRRGAQPKQLAFSAALGITLGLFPICGVTIFLCGMAIALFGSFCHAPTVMLANFIATPIELSLVVPFLRFGELISDGDHFPLTSDALKKVLTGEASREVILSVAHAGSATTMFHVFFSNREIFAICFEEHRKTGKQLIGWLGASPFILGTLYVAFLPCFKILLCKFGSSTKKPLVSQSDAKLS